ncbi:MAG: glycosyltransferase family 4 protein [Alphaproteobacteria bacterium]
MRIFFFTTVFAPSVGGIERMAEMLCGAFVAQGHEVQLATSTPGDGGDDRFPYPVHRRPGGVRFARLLRWCDVHVQANVSLKHAWPLVAAPGRVVYRHANVYQRDDGTVGLLDRAKRWVARRAPGIANSRYTARQLGCRHTILNAYDDTTFRCTQPWDERPGELVFLGRLVSQKGCDTLLDALGRLREAGRTPALTVIGDGPDRTMLQDRARALGIASQVTFAGRLEGTALAAALNRHRIVVVPSRYEEPFGIVALEALACGCVPVVSERGGLIDAVGSHGVGFPNGDDAALADRLKALLADPAAARRRLAGTEAHLAQFRRDRVAARYAEVFTEVVGRA